MVEYLRTLVVAFGFLFTVFTGNDRGRIADFDDGTLEASSGLDWIVIGDDLIGGASEASLETVRPGAQGSSAALRFSGTIREGFASPFSGAWAALHPAGVTSTLIPSRGIRFWARGSGPSFLVGIRQGVGSASANFMTSFTPTAEWSVYEAAFDKLAQGPRSNPARAFSLEDVSWMGFTTAPPGVSGSFWLEVDGIELLVTGKAADRSSPSGGSRTLKVRLTPPGETGHLNWTALATDDRGDGRFPRLPDATALAYALDPKSDVLWFRIDLSGEPPQKWLGVNIAIDGDEDPASGLPWWGFNKEFRFDRLVSAYLMKTGSDSRDYQGVLGVADVDGINAFDFTNLGAGNVKVTMDREKRTLLLGIPRKDVDADGRFRLIATVGSAFLANDDLPNRGFATVGATK